MDPYLIDMVAWAFRKWPHDPAKAARVIYILTDWRKR